MTNAQAPMTKGRGLWLATTLCVVVLGRTLCVLRTTQSVGDGVPTQSVGTRGLGVGMRAKLAIAASTVGVVRVGGLFYTLRRLP